MNGLPGGPGEQMRSAESAHNRQPTDGGEESRSGRESSPSVASPGDAGERARARAKHIAEVTLASTYSTAELQKLPLLKELLSEIANEVAAALQSERTAAASQALTQFMGRLSTRLNDHLVGMKLGYDDSIVGFNEAWDIMRELAAEYQESKKP